MPDMPDDSREELTSRARAFIRGLVRGADVRNGSDYDLKARILAAVAYGIQTQASVLTRLLDPRKSFGVFLREYAGIQGVGGSLLETSIAAQRASGYAIITSSTNTQLQLSGSVLTHADGTAYATTANATTAGTGKVLRAGHRSGRRRIYQGHEGAGFVTAADGEVYSFTPTGELCAIYGSSNGAYSHQYTVDLYNELDADPAMHDQFVQQFGAVVSIRAASGGLVGNKDAKDTLTLSSPSGTISATARILRLTGGRDELNVSAMQSAIRELQGTRLGTMTLEEIRQIGLGYPTTKFREFFLFPGKYGVGTYEIMPVAEDGVLVNSTDLAAIDDYVAARTSPVDKFTATTLNDEKDNLVTLEVKVAPNLGPDWNLPEGGTRAVGVSVASTVSRVNLLTTAGMEVDDRVIVSCAQAADPFCTYIVQRRITAIGVTYIDVDSPLPYPPVAGQAVVTPGGPLGQDIIDAVYAHYDAQSPSGVNTSPSVQYQRYPAPASTENIQGLYARVADVEGVLDTSGYYTAAPTLAYNDVLFPGAIEIKMWT